MKAEKDKVVGFDYSLTVDGEKLESSFDSGEALWVLLGRGQLIPGLEAALEGQEAGATLSVDISPEQGYGERSEGMTQRVPKKYFQQAAKLKPGMTTVLALKEGGHRAVVVQKVGMTTVDVDLNHPMAGKSLHFDVTVNAVRDASAEELEHGHAHPPGAEAH
ncbi:FKBP-type peptidyl-prolyl cis-trans isomerase [Frateuria aurantia]|uniref:Peptidyl-prolyl cis-trans isomerase n=1 Tax=Frateuria aurantia (strain ATCC 33424 / DSM 6220 / KCTC 2777 / LMG 1558 / NBRC 3245 / NCIMB 13370) TaxID=767434 RepID=H8L4G5_FRAAD|nr:peptidylprolyl isomerase [Frateuria aurantia]AFC85639.1 FKBP-type peptidyl-prolyl cis-trans isomerase [Frateuria aurantia DSM 6220]